MLPEAARCPLRDQIRYARELYDADRSGDAPGVQLPHALEWKEQEGIDGVGMVLGLSLPSDLKGSAERHRTAASRA